LRESGQVSYLPPCRGQPFTLISTGLHVLKFAIKLAFLPHLLIV
jgi:hypothetical protein